MAIIVQGQRLFKQLQHEYSTMNQIQVTKYVQKSLYIELRQRNQEFSL